MRLRRKLIIYKIKIAPGVDSLDIEGGYFKRNNKFPQNKALRIKEY